MANMKEQNELTQLFSSKLSQAKLAPREDFWEKLQADLHPMPMADEAALNGRKHSLWLVPRYRRWAAAASVLLVLGAASAAFWHFSPREEMRRAFDEVATLTPTATLDGDRVQTSLPSPFAQAQAGDEADRGRTAGTAAADSADGTGEGRLSLSLSITVREWAYRQSGRRHTSANGSPYVFAAHPDTYRSVQSYERSVAAEADAEPAAMAEPKADKLRTAVKMALGTSLPTVGGEAPLTFSLTLEKPLNERFALEGGLQYSRLPEAVHMLAIPLKLHTRIASTPKLDFYASVGATAEKCVGGAPDCGFSAEPVQLSVAAGLGVSYRLNERLAFFAEPAVSHHFDTAKSSLLAQNRRATNLNMLCGMRVTY